MGLVGVGAATILVFVALGGMVGIVFGFFGMGSFLVTPALLVMGYDSRVVVGSGLAFVFGTAVIGTLRHSDFGQVDYRLGVLLIGGTVLGIEIGKRLVLLLETIGFAGVVVGITYVLLLTVVGSYVIHDAIGGSGDIRSDRLDSVVRMIQDSLRDPFPGLSLREGGTVSILGVLTVAVGAGVLSGLLGVGGGFLRLPALTYVFGLSLPVAVGTNIFAVMFAGAFGSFTWAQVGGVDLSIVAPLLVGSGLGARVGSAMTRLVADDEMKETYGALLIAAAAAVALRQVGDALGIEVLGTASLGLLLGATFLVSASIVYGGVAALRDTPGDQSLGAD